MNRHSIMRFGSTFEFTEMKLHELGYWCEWSFMQMQKIHGGYLGPPDLPWKGSESGWEMRRKIKEWCKGHDYRDYRIVRNTKYCKDLHGAVYEIWPHKRDSVRRQALKWAAQGVCVDDVRFRSLVSMAQYAGADCDCERWIFEELTSAGYERSNDNPLWTIRRKG